MLKLVSLYFQPSLNLFMLGLSVTASLNVNPSKAEWRIYFNWHSSAISVTSSISFQLTILAPRNTTRHLGAIINKTYALNIIVPASANILQPYSSSLPYERSTIIVLHKFRNHPRKLSGLFKFATVIHYTMIRSSAESLDRLQKCKISCLVS